MSLTNEPVTTSSALDAERLSQRLLAALRATLFDSRLSVTPRRVGQIAAEAAGAFTGYRGDPADDAAAHAAGRRLAQEGLGHASILAIVAALHDAALAGPGATLPAAGRHATQYCGRLLAGYMAAREADLLVEQERTRQALDRARGQAGP